jgi:bifunctional UDP-N-acetylglucosamine pyrophosphorylase / glucosamine-1-phosphate N-acetyltransferase
MTRLKRVSCPLTQQNITIGTEVKRDRISDGATIHAGCRILGSRTLVCQGAELGAEAPVTVNDCYIGPKVKLKGGYFENAVFLEGAEAGSGAHVRRGTILEEQASIAHTVGLKQTILFPFVTLGSLINFCDCFMAGGIDRKNHSEVGSSYIHFNYTPNQDKATASLIGDVPNGVMLNQAPIFLGGQGGLVGPCRIAFGTVIAAGSVYRKDQLKPDRLVFEGKGRGGSIPYSPGLYRNVKRQAVNNIIYMANLVALMAWYVHIRGQFVGDRFPPALHDGLIATLRLAIGERGKRFTEFCKKLPISKKVYQQQMGDSDSTQLLNQKDELFNARHRVPDKIKDCLENIDRYNLTPFLSIIRNRIDRTKGGYIDVIRSLDADERVQGSAWLQAIVDEVTGKMLDIVPTIR